MPVLLASGFAGAKSRYFLQSLPACFSLCKTMGHSWPGWRNPVGAHQNLPVLRAPNGVMAGGLEYWGNGVLYFIKARTSG